MHRSSSSNKVSEKLFSSSSGLSTSASSPSLILRQTSLPSEDVLDGLPTFHPKSFLAKRQKSRFRFAESAVHVIPLLLIFCAVVLWFFSKPEPSFEYTTHHWTMDV